MKKVLYVMLLLLIPVALSLFFSGCRPSPKTAPPAGISPSGTIVPPQSETIISPSAPNPVQLFSTYCASCHSLVGSRVSGPGGLLNSERLARLTRAQIVETIQKGQGIMPPFKNNLSLQEIEALIAFLK